MKFVAAITTAVAALAVVVVNAKKCQDITLPVSVTAARNGRFDQAALTPADNIAVKNFILNLSQQGSDYISKILRGVSSPK